VDFRDEKGHRYKKTAVVKGKNGETEELPLFTNHDAIVGEVSRGGDQAATWTLCSYQQLTCTLMQQSLPDSLTAATRAPPNAAAPVLQDNVSTATVTLLCQHFSTASHTTLLLCCRCASRR
jgi:hypothetical protein